VKLQVINFDFYKNRLLLSSSLHCSLTADSTAFNFVMLISYASWTSSFPVSPFPIILDLCVSIAFTLRVFGNEVKITFSEKLKQFCFFIFWDCFDVLISKIIFFKIKKNYFNTFYKRKSLWNATSIILLNTPYFILC